MLNAIMSLTQVPMIPIILDLLDPLNTSRQKIILVKADYIVDPFEYYIELHILTTITGLVNLLTVLSMDATYLISVHQICGIFRIVELVFHLCKPS